MEGVYSDWEKSVNLGYYLEVKLIEFGDGLNVGEGGGKEKVKDGYR